MNDAARTFKIARPRNFDHLQSKFKDSGRCQIGAFLPGLKVKKLRQVLDGLSWHLAYNDGPQHVELPPMQVAAMGSARVGEISEFATQRAQTEFQYLYENFPVFDILAAGRKLDPLIADTFATMNSPELLALISELTGERADFCDMQATRFSAGHFLNEHDDGIEGKNRTLAYVINLSQNWSLNSGGMLQFINEDAEVSEEFRPAFNCLSIFKVPTLHRVSPVTKSTTNKRVSLTGWFRTY